MTQQSVIAAIDYTGPRGDHHIDKAGDFVTVRLSEVAELWGRLGAEITVEMRSHGNPPGIFMGVQVKVGQGEAPVLEWSGVAPSPGNVTQGARGVLERSSTHGRGIDRDRGGRWPDVTPRPGIDPASAEWQRRSAAWAAGETHRLQRPPTVHPSWDASDWAAAAAEYWRLRLGALDADAAEGEVTG